MGKKWRFLAVLGMLSILVVPLSSYGAEDFPIRPIEMVVPWGPGGGSDIFGRKVSNLAEKYLGQPIAVFNVPGATGQTGVNKALAARPDGYTVVEVVSDNVLLDAMGKSNFSYKDLTWIARGQLSYSLFFVPMESKYKTWDEIIKLAKENPGELRVATSGKGSTDDIIISFLATQGIKFTFVPYNKPSERYVSPLRGETDLLFEQIGDIQSLLEAKKYRPLVACYKKRSPDFPDTPTLGEYGVDLALPIWRGIAAKKGVPADRLRILVDAFKKAILTDDYKTFAKETRTDQEPPVFGDDYNKFVEEDYNQAVKLLKEIGLQH